MLGRIGSTRAGTALLRATAPGLDRIAARLTGGRRTVTEWVVPTLLLTTTGRRSGQLRSTPLAFVRHGDALAVAASNWGQPHHPGWSENLLADPHATVVVDGRQVDVVARLAAPDERTVLWPRFDTMYAGFAAYRQRADRRAIRIFVLEPER